MSHLLILCEGETEHRILKAFLQPYWSQRFDSAEVQSYQGNGELKRKFAFDVKQELSEPDSSVLCLVDLYEEPFKLYSPGKTSPKDGFKAVQTRMYSLIDRRFHNRFGAFPVIMELETWLLADPHAMQHIGSSPLKEPETIVHPAEYLERLRRDHNSSYAKVIDGVKLFGLASATRVYQDNCPHFQVLIDWLIKPPDTPPDPIPEKLRVWEQECNRLQEHLLMQEQLLENDPSEENLNECIRAGDNLDNHLKKYGIYN